MEGETGHTKACVPCCDPGAVQDAVDVLDVAAANEQLAITGDGDASLERACDVSVGRHKSVVANQDECIVWHDSGASMLSTIRQSSGPQVCHGVVLAGRCMACKRV